MRGGGGASQPSAPNPSCCMKTKLPLGPFRQPLPPIFMDSFLDDVQLSINPSIDSPGMGTVGQRSLFRVEGIECYGDAAQQICPLHYIPYNMIYGSVDEEIYNVSN